MQRYVQMIRQVAKADGQRAGGLMGEWLNVYDWMSAWIQGQKEE